MTSRPASSHPSAILEQLREFLREEAKAIPRMPTQERSRVEDLLADVRRLATGQRFAVAAGFGRVFAAFETLSSIGARRPRRARHLPMLDERARTDAWPRDFADDYATFDRLSILYGGLFRGSVIVNYLLGVVAVALTLCSILPQPQFLSPSGAPFFPDFAWYAVRLEVACIVIIGAIFCSGQTPHRASEEKRSGERRSWMARRLAHRWHERWLEYRVLAERFRYLELMLSLSPSAAIEHPFAATEGDNGHWYDRYFVWRTLRATPAIVDVGVYRERALALMLEQIEHHDATSARRGTIAARLHRWAVWLFFASLALCLAELVTGSMTRMCLEGGNAAVWCGGVAFLNDNLRSPVLFGAILAPVLAAAIHGVLETTEYTKVAESSRQTSDRIAALVDTILKFSPPADTRADAETLTPIRHAVVAFADATINEASGWRAMLRDKNIPLA